MCTVGYGELYPVTTVGRIAAVVLMVAGVALFGWLTASLASLFVESDSEVRARPERACLQEQMDDVSARLERIERLLEHSRSGSAADETRGYERS